MYTYCRPIADAGLLAGRLAEVGASGLKAGKLAWSGYRSQMEAFLPAARLLPGPAV